MSMQLLQLLQESSSLSVPDLKKAMMKDPKAAIIFKKDLTLDQIQDKDAFLATMKFYVFNNENVRDFIRTRHNIKDVSVNTLNEYRKMRGADMTQNNLTWLQDFVNSIFKEHSSVHKGSMSTDLKKQLKDWFNGNGRYFNLPAWAVNELMSIPTLRPDKRVVLYRGVLFGEGSLGTHESYDGTLEVGNGLKFLRSIKKGGKEVDLSWSRPSSWSTSKEVADRFAKYGPASSQFGAMMQWFDRSSKKAAIDGALGYVISTLANPEDILLDTKRLSASIPMAHGDESEVILKPGTYLARVVKKYTVEGEVEPTAVDTDEKELPAAAALKPTKDFAASFSIPEEQLGILTSSENSGPRIWSSSALLLIRKPEVFKKLILNSTTTTVLHSFDKLIEFYNKELKELQDDDLRADKFATKEELGSKIQKLKKFIAVFNDKVVHSKFKSDKNPKAVGKKFEMTADEYRSSLKAFDINSIEKDLLTAGHIVDSDAARAFTDLAKSLNVDLPSSARFNQFGAAKQKPVIEEVLKKFFKIVNLSYDEENQTENVKHFVNLARKAYRNYAMLEELRGIQERLKELK